MRSECLRLSCESIPRFAKATMNCLLRSDRTSRLIESMGSPSRSCLAKILIVSRCRERADRRVDLSTSPTVIGWEDSLPITLSNLRWVKERSGKMSLAFTGDHHPNRMALPQECRKGHLPAATLRVPRVRRCKVYRQSFDSLNSSS